MRFRHRLAQLAGIAALSALTAAGLLASFGNESGWAGVRPAALEIRPDQLTVDLHPGDQRILSVAFVSRSGRPIRLLGANSHCGRDVCLWIEDSHFPAVIAPYERIELPVRVESKRPADSIHERISIYTDAAGCGELTLSVSGRSASP